MYNAPYGKTSENGAKNSDIRLIVDEHKAVKFVKKRHCIDFRIFATNLFSVEMRKTISLINKLFYVGIHYVIHGISIVLT